MSLATGVSNRNLELKILASITRVMENSEHQKEKMIGARRKRKEMISGMKVSKSTNADQYCKETAKGDLLQTSANLCENGDEAEKILHPSAKIKLQLFPIDEATRTGLEKEGYNPYLELTLRARKKISSVLKHINCKWGSSSISTGDPMLFPFNISLENLVSCRRWTLNDTGITAGDVYEATERPAIFRLRYGWFSNSDPKTFEMRCISTLGELCLPVEVIKQVRGTNVEVDCGQKNETIDFTPVNASEESKTVEAMHISSNVQLDHGDDEGRIDNGLPESSTLWIDNLSNISIGGLLSEASLQGNFKNSNSRSNWKTLTQLLTSDSFDSFIAAQFNPHPPPPSSILDAEETCHSFSFKKFCSSKDVAAEVNNQAAVSETHASHECKTDPLPCSREMHNDDNSLGLTGIKWSDSLGPFDLGLSSTQKLISGKE